MHQNLFKPRREGGRPLSCVALVDVQAPVFLVISGVLRAAVDVSGSAWKWLNIDTSVDDESRCEDYRPLAVPDSLALAAPEAPFVVTVDLSACEE
jgi:hypothetical protein